MKTKQKKRKIAIFIFIANIIIIIGKLNRFENYKHLLFIINKIVIISLWKLNEIVLSEF